MILEKFDGIFRESLNRLEDISNVVVEEPSFDLQSLPSAVTFVAPERMKSLGFRIA